ncbi:S-adenosyl-L-methionine-dependent methyltransferases superfamily protein [Euphorbia peplus]|nr:S-adenosyl-L-methionine-dependent methyltransferases superfamily protein [Euphorbia peplus]
MSPPFAAAAEVIRGSVSECPRRIEDGDVDVVVVVVMFNGSVFLALKRTQAWSDDEVAAARNAATCISVAVSLSLGTQQFSVRFEVVVVVFNCCRRRRRFSRCSRYIEDVPENSTDSADLNPHAINVTRETLDAHGVDAELIATNIASGLETRLEGKVDVMVVNPPYVPTPEDEVGCKGIASAWAGGENGRRVIDRILPVADKLLSDKGWLYMVTLTENHPSQICIDMRKRGYASRIIVQRSTEEESLHIIKFWRDPDTQIEAKKTLTSNKTIPQRVMESLVSQFPQLSFQRKDSDN